MLKQGIIAISLLTAWNLHAQDVTPYTPGATPEGIVYYLPKTELEIKVTATKTTYTPGEFCQYADRYLRLQNVAPKPHVQWNLQSIEVTPKGVPNPERAYSIKLKDKSVASEVQLTKEGIIRAINTNVPEDVIPQKAAVKKTERVNPRNFMTEEILMAGSSIKMAELVAKEIYNIRESRNLLLRGQSENIPKDGEGLQIILNNIKEQEEALMQLFTGTTTIEESTHTFQIFPESEAERLIFGRFSRKLGLLHQDDLGGAPLYIDIKSRNSVPTASVETGEASKKDAAKPKKSKLAKQDGLVYNIPGKADVKIYTNTVTLADDVLSLTQFGNKETLSSSLFSKRKGIRVILDPKDGSIKKIEE